VTSQLGAAVAVTEERLGAGVHPKVVQERLGHASIQITLDTYSHVMPGMQADAAAKLGKLVFGKSRRGARRPPDRSLRGPYAMDPGGQRVACLRLFDRSTIVRC
jgi:hypothetical protein